MTPYEMRREAARDRAAADALVVAAGRLRAIAASIRGLLSGLVEASQRVWRGPAATDFESRADAADRELRAQADVLGDTAGDFDAEASRLRAAARALELAADQQEAAAAAAAAAAALPPGAL